MFNRLPKYAQTFTCFLVGPLFSWSAIVAETSIIFSDTIEVGYYLSQLFNSSRLMLPRWNFKWKFYQREICLKLTETRGILLFTRYLEDESEGVEKLSILIIKRPGDSIIAGVSDRWIANYLANEYVRNVIVRWPMCVSRRGDSPAEHRRG